MTTAFKHETIHLDAEEHDKLVRYIRKANLVHEWVIRYLDLGRELLEGTRLRNSDKQLATTTPGARERFMPIIINTRWVIIGYRCWNTNDPLFSVAVIYSWYLWQKSRAHNISRVTYEGGFRPTPREKKNDTQPPYFLNLNTIDDVTQRIKQDWIETACDEIENASGSLQRQFHKPAAYKLITDLDYRAQVLDEAFSSR
jgi:hypothetical protein